MDYEGKICDVCGKPVIEGENNIPTEKLVGTRKFGDDPHPYVEVHLEIKKVTVGCFSDAQESGGEICVSCLCDLLKDCHSSFSPQEYDIPSKDDDTPF